jgi:hypothetical protein
MSIRPKPVSEKYFGMPLSDGQSADEPYDPASKGNKAEDTVFKTGRGSQGGGSKKTSIPKGSANHKKGSYPSKSQKIRG